MTLGLCMESLSGPGRAGTPIRDSFLLVLESRLGWALESDSMAGLAGDGTTGDQTGITTMSFTTTTRTSLTAEFSSTVTTSIAREDFAEEVDFEAVVDFTAALRAAGASPLVGNRAPVEVSTEAEDFMVAAVVMVAEVTGKSVRLQT